METLKTTYREFEIVYAEYENKWKCELNDANFLEKDSLAECKKKIDEWYKKQNQRINVIYIGDSNYYNNKKFGSKAVITSVNEQFEGWVTFQGKREKVSTTGFNNYVLDTPENESIIQKYLEQKNIAITETKKAYAILATTKKAVIIPEEKEEDDDEEED